MTLVWLMITKYLSITVCVPTTVYSGPKSKDLLNMGKINGLMISNGRVKVKISEIRATISMKTILQSISLILIYISVHSLFKAFNLSSCVIWQNVEIFSFTFCDRVLGLLTIHWQKPVNCLSLFDHSMGLAPKGLTFIARLSQLLLSVF